MTYKAGNLTIEHDRETSGRVIIVSGGRACGKTTWIESQIEDWEAVGVTCVHMVSAWGDEPAMRVDNPRDRRTLDQIIADRSIGRIYVEKGE